MLKLQFKDKPSRSYWLVGEQLSLGSAKDCNVVLEGLGVNLLHAQISINADVLSILPVDDSVCYVNNQVIKSVHTLVEGDEIRIAGDRILIIDPKTAKTTDTKAKAGRVSTKPKVWTLIAEHPKLKDRPLLITTKSILGRSKEVNLFIPFKHLSREHAELTVEGDVLKLKDLGSSNGCFVNGERVDEYSLVGGETVSFAFLDFSVIAPTALQKEVAMDVTMVRSAITQEDIDRVQREQKEHSQSLDLSEIDKSYGARNVNTAKTHSKLWGGISILLLAVMAYGLWRYFA